MPLVEVDRIPRHEIGMLEPFEKAAVRLEQRQLKNEKWLALSEDSTLKAILANSLSAIHSEWASLSLAKGEYGPTSRSMDKAIGYCWRFQTFCKWLLILISPFSIGE
jgi:hypothetical protein